jgi:beta-phosphoglucomutase-like phosphatase (HAD superfamily)
MRRSASTGKLRPMAAATDTAACSDPAVPLLLDALGTHWRAAFDLAETALHSARAELSDGDLHRRTLDLRAERVLTAAALERVAYEHTARSWQSDLLIPAHELPRLLGVPVRTTACVFNLDGVLTGSATAHAAAWETVLNGFIAARVERTGGRFPPFDTRVDYFTHLHGRPRLVGLRAFLASRGISLPEGQPDDPPTAETVQGLANRKREVLLLRLEEEGLAAFTGSRRYLQLARDAGLRRAVVSASANTKALLAHAGISDLVDAYIDGNDMVEYHLGVAPSPDALLAAAERVGCTPEHAVVFETTPAGVEAGLSGSFSLVVGIAEPAVVQIRLRAQGAAVVAASLDDLLGRNRMVLRPVHA